MINDSSNSSSATPSFHCIGRIHSSQGVRGQVFVRLNPTDLPWLKRWTTLILTDEENRFQNPRNIRIVKVSAHAKQGGEGFVLTLEGFDNKDQADAIQKKWIWIPADFLVSKKGETIFLKEIEGFVVIDRERGEVGPIVGFGSNGPQDLLRVDRAGTVYEVPFVKAFIENIDFENKKINMNIPMGLLEDIE